MLRSLFKRAEATVDHAVTGFVLKLLVAIPFLVAMGFLTAAATIFLNRRFDAETGYLIMTAAFLLIGVVGAAAISGRNGASSPASGTAGDTATSAGKSAGSDEPALDGTDRELLMSALAAVAPAAAPAIMRLFVRNLPLIAAVAAAGFILMRPPEQSAREEGVLEPAE